MNRQSVQKRVTSYEVNKARVELGKNNHVPFFGFNKLQKYIPGIVPSIMYKITSHMGVGKTQIAKYLFCYQPIMYAIKYKINFKIIYFALEESKEEFLDGLFIHLIRRIHNVQLDRFVMTGMSDRPLNQAELDVIKSTQKIMAEIAANIEIVDDKYRPTEMFDTCKYYARKWGRFIKDGEGNETDDYVPSDPNQIVLVVADHISLIEPEFEKETNKYLTERQAISKWHTKMGKRILTKKWNWAMLNIQQQNLESEKQQYTMKGDSIISKILPSLDGLANNKEVARDDYVVLGLFAPDRYDIPEFRGYNIQKNTPESFGDRFRTMHLLKNRFGHPNKVLPLYFDGRYNYFKEMPLSTDPSMRYFEDLLTK